MPDLVLDDFPPSLLARLDRYIQLLEQLNPGHTWTRSECVATLLARALADVEGAELRHRRRSGDDRRSEPRGHDRRQGPDRRDGEDRRAGSYAEMVDLVIEHLLRQKRSSDATWRDRFEGE